MRGGSISRAAEVARQRRGNCRQFSGGIGSARAAEAVQRRHWMRWWQLRGSRQQGGRAAAAAERWRWRQNGNSGGSAAEVVAAWWRRQQSGRGSTQAAAERWQRGSMAAALAARWRHWQCGGIVSRSSMAAARQKRAARRQHLQCSFSGRSMVAALAERWRQHGSGAAMAGRVEEVSAARGRWQQCSGGSDEQGQSRVTGWQRRQR